MLVVESRPHEKASRESHPKPKNPKAQTPKAQNPSLELCGDEAELRRKYAATLWVGNPTTKTDRFCEA